ncbi:hypothetical protein SUGI_1048200 [Cryptomeria japonica]|nr:hypothetical protein SUGI_1048200 [Cryptomeria japonica]
MALHANIVDHRKNQKATNYRQSHANLRNLHKTPKIQEENSKSEEILIYVSEEVESNIEIISELAIICKFISPNMARASIRKWIEAKWMIEVIIKFLPKKFFLVIFANAEEKEKIEYGGLWQMGSVPLYMQPWQENFNPLLTDPYDAPIWIRLYNLSLEYWANECLEKSGGL